MIRYAQKNDLEQLRKLDQHLAPSELEQCIRDGRVLVLIRQELVGCLRYNLFWDNLPFMNLLFLAEDERGKGYGTQLIQFWEEEMRRQQHRSVMTSTQSDEQQISLPEAWICGLWGPAAARRAVGDSALQAPARIECSTPLPSEPVFI